MNIGILKDIKGDRVIITPDTAKVLIKQGHSIYFASSSGDDSGYSDASYLNVGALKLKNNEDVVKKCNLLTSYRMPSSDLLNYLTSKHTLLSYSNIVKNKDKANIISLNGATLIGMEFISNNGKKEIAYKLSKLVSMISFTMMSYHYNRPIIGGGKIIDNLPFTNKTNVTILGYGNIGKELSKIFSNKNCVVSVFDKDIAVFDSVDDLNISCFNINDSRLEDCIINSDIIISAISNGFTPTKQFITKEFIQKLKKNSLIFDLSINQGGTFESSKETTMNNPIFMYKDVMHCCPSDILITTGKPFSDYISNCILKYVILLAEGYSGISCFDDATLVDKGTIKREISFLEGDDADIGIVTDPFDLMDSEISQTWKYADDINDILAEIDDYEHEV